MKLAILLSAAFVITAFNNKSCEENERKPSLYSTKWVLKKIHTGSDIEDVTINTAFIKFNMEKTAGGKGGCNSFGSTFTIDNDKISIEDLFSTKMYCEAIQSKENAFFKSLTKTTRFEIKDSTLLLFDDAGLLLELEKSES